MRILSTMISITLFLSGCSTAKKCGQADGFNSIYEKGTCQARIRSVFIGEQLSPELKGRLKSNPNLKVEWIETATVGDQTTPGHIAISSDTGESK